MRAYLLLLLLVLLARAAGLELLPIIKFAFQNPGPGEISISPKERDVPAVFQYRISLAASKPGWPWYADDDRERKREPWFLDSDVFPVVPGRYTCRALVLAGYVPVRRTFNGPVEQIRLEPVPSEQVWGKETLKTEQPGILLNRLSSCCDASACTDRCLQYDTAQAGYLEVLAPQWGVYEPDKKITPTFGGSYTTEGERGDPGVWPVYRVPCDFCPLKSCITNCTNGQFATGLADFSQAGFQATRLECKPCAPGTWNTCRDKTECRWGIPTAADKHLLGNEIWTISGGPVPACYACRYAQYFWTHYMGTALEVVIDPGLAWKCPGGASPPENCLTPEFTTSADGSQCACKPRYYQDTPTTCKLCPKGHMCPEGVLVKCPIHYYQPSEGATECLACNSLGTASGFFRCTTRGYLLKVCSPAIPGTQDAPLNQNCVPCNQCRRAYANTEDSLQSECYREN